MRLRRLFARERDTTATRSLSSFSRSCKATQYQRWRCQAPSAHYVRHMQHSVIDTIRSIESCRRALQSCSMWVLGSAASQTIAKLAFIDASIAAKIAIVVLHVGSPLDGATVTMSIAGRRSLIDSSPRGREHPGQAQPPRPEP